MSSDLVETQGVRLAIEGCGHGTLHDIYASVREACKRREWPGVDLLIIGGDFQSVRNAYDLNCRTAPYLTVFVGGNHEASNYLFELYYGGWVAPNIYYMGAANVLRLGPLRIAGMSGIWKGYNFRKPHHERLPYNESDLKSIYHTRELDIRKLLQIRSQVDIGISHDWPKGVEWRGNWKELFRFKKHLEDDARSGQLGSVAAQQVLDHLRPRHWFSAHLHCKYAAVVDHNDTQTPQQPLPVLSTSVLAPKNDNEINLDDDLDDIPAGVESTTNVNDAEIDLELEDDVDGIAEAAPGQGVDGLQVPVEDGLALSQPTLSEEAAAARSALPDAFKRQRPAIKEPVEHPPDITNTTTNFLALDKCLPQKQFLQLLDIPTIDDQPLQRPMKLCYDREWLSITRAIALSEPPQFGNPEAAVPRSKGQSEYRTLIEEQTKWVDENLRAEQLVMPEDFEITAPTYDGGNWNLPQYAQVAEYPNPQTAKFCEMLQMPNALDISEEDRAARLAAGPRPDPDAERFNASRGRGGFAGGRGRGNDRGRGRGRGRGGGRGRGRGR